MPFTLRCKRPQTEPRAELSEMSNPAAQRSSFVMSGFSSLRLMAFLLALALTLPAALAANVRAAFSRDVTVPSEPVRLEIRVEGGRPSAPPRDIKADGVNVSFLGSSQSFKASQGVGGFQ